MQRSKSRSPAQPTGRPVARRAVALRLGPGRLQDAGNQALQRRHNLSTPGDADERRADRLAAHALRTGAGSAAGGSAAARTPVTGQGQPLPASVLGDMEARFGEDFSGVRYRDDSAAHHEARSLDARAFTRGQTISFSAGQFAPHTPQGRELLAHELAHVAAAGDPQRVYRETWDVDDSAGTVERGISVQLIFENTWTDWWNNTGWTESRKATFRSNFESSIENTFNNSGMVLNPPASAVDVLPPAIIASGYRPLVDISLVGDGETSVSEDWEVDVSSNPTGEFRTSSSNRSYGTLDEADNTPIEKEGAPSNVEQIPSVHEFGHFIGLMHPGYNMDEDEWSPGAGSEYGHSGTDEHGHAVHGPTDLMGTGMGLRPFYFDEWAQAVDRHIAELRRERSWEEFQRSIDRFIGGDREMGDFPVPDGATRFG
ncbi:DUF4157 domain-containing protein [Mangrovimicrobium sediminis]|uniref:DUF4157 domain-containing protein n=1 Tax=Mangrovimicrobium sediminis TaxID=2562682 RepID=A0A4Z0MA42_9GAMM|nr:DUF4157 domain-containing protein [Haliea sp. SAOS-164]TGD76165.1 DUF4157 domain-containing protein [Haliea sp. SAOS-164]